MDGADCDGDDAAADDYVMVMMMLNFATEILFLVCCSQSVYSFHIQVAALAWQIYMSPSLISSFSYKGLVQKQ